MDAHELQLRLIESLQYTHGFTVEEDTTPVQHGECSRYGLGFIPSPGAGYPGIIPRITLLIDNTATQKFGENAAIRHISSPDVLLSHKEDQIGEYFLCTITFHM